MWGQWKTGRTQSADPPPRREQDKNKTLVLSTFLFFNYCNMLQWNIGLNSPCLTFVGKRELTGRAEETISPNLDLLRTAFSSLVVKQLTYSIFFRSFWGSRCIELWRERVLHDAFGPCSGPPLRTLLMLGARDERISIFCSCQNCEKWAHALTQYVNKLHHGTMISPKKHILLVEGSWRTFCLLHHVTVW